MGSWWMSRGFRSKSAAKGSAGPLKTASSKDGSSSSRCSPTKVRVDGVLVDFEGFSHSRRSTPSSRPQVPPKPATSDRLKKAEQNLVLSNQFSALMMRWTRHPSCPTEAMEHSINKRNVRGFQANFEELAYTFSKAERAPRNWLGSLAHSIG